MKNEHKKTWKKPELKKLSGKETESGTYQNPGVEAAFYYNSLS
jgi:hypothetical protein